MIARLDHDNGVSTLTLDRPAKRNALNVEMSQAIWRALDEAREQPGILVVRSSTPGTFVAGADIADLAQRTRVEALSRLNQDLFLKLEEFPWPSVAVVDGPALGGGCELALACDFRVGSTRSVWGLPEVRLGIIPSAGGLWRLPRLIGWAAATELIHTGRRVGAEEARQLGLLHRLCEPGELEGTMDGLLGELRKASLTAVRYAKEAMRAPQDRNRVGDAALQALCFESEDARQRLGAFLARSKGTS
ncbi:enoyl-CoA hydratase/isomerase family protein [Saccharomonospora sp. NPDC006951]